MRSESVLSSGSAIHLGHPLVENTGQEIHNNSFLESLSAHSSKIRSDIPRKVLIGLLLLIALLAFEVFNFDTTQYALEDFLGEVSFLTFRWATILAVAFCAIDFAGLAYLFGTDQAKGSNREVWYLMGAWLLGATMNALMTWWAVSVTLLGHELGNEVMSRADLLQIVPIFVAVLVWLTRILFIGSFSVAGNHLFGLTSEAQYTDRNLHKKAIKGRASRPVSPSPLPKPVMAARSRRR